ncbi:hypothetical protein BLEM_0019 [Bifidobacterium lemurum]|uniref:Cyclophilin-like domain-containing protein n=1 Tax=Bifidobacterium lemurum TaxID=1603886 RepID=A0A261FX36_9BIFI|nr:cyclophilin-like fold protein [Bifidobacterium lemurum]OZG63316.1 hypothetical protein BLEM_0019 [Bifidobacterium lemurum]
MTQDEYSTDSRRRAAAVCGTLLAAMLLLGACGATASDTADATTGDGASSSSSIQDADTTTDGSAITQEDETMQDDTITTQRINVQDENGTTVVFELNGSSAANDLLGQLPMTVAVENFSTNEKIFYPDALDVSDTPLASVAVGTLAYYEPWGDVVMFYGSYNANNALYELGHVVSGGDAIANLSGTITIAAG